MILLIANASWMLKVSVGFKTGSESQLVHVEDLSKTMRSGTASCHAGEEQKSKKESKYNAGSPPSNELPKTMQTAITTKFYKIDTFL